MFITLAAVLVVVVSLYLLGAVFVASFAVDRALTLQTRKVEVAVFLNRDVTTEERDSIQPDLLAMPEVARPSIYESKQEAYERFKQLFARRAGHRRKRRRRTRCPRASASS